MLHPTRLILTGVVAAVVTLTATTSCGPTRPLCSAANCIGCCGEDGTCHAGTVPDACGTNAVACQDCGDRAFCSGGMCLPAGSSAARDGGAFHRGDAGGSDAGGDSRPGDSNDLPDDDAGAGAGADTDAGGVSAQDGGPHSAHDAGAVSPSDAGTKDAGTGSSPDAGTKDAGTGSPPDAGPKDAGTPDAGAQLCTNGARRCVANDVQVCASGVWTFDHACGATATCQSGSCVPKYDCASDCGSGAAACNNQSCANGAGVCWAGLCVPSDCRQGDSQCGGNPWVVQPHMIECADTRTSGNDHWLSQGECGVTTGVGLLSPDHAWRFFPPSTRQYKVTVTPLEPWDVAIHLLSSFCAPNSGCYGVSNKVGTSVAETLTFQGVAGIEYIIVIDGVENQTVGGGPLAGRSGYYTISVD